MSSPFVYSYCTWPTSTLEELCGGKAANLFELREILQCVPKFYVITSEALRQTLKGTGLAPRIKQMLESTSNNDLGTAGSVSTEIRSWLRELDVPLQLQEEIRKVHCATVPSDTLFAVRSSVVGEDSTGRSFAGMHDSLLGVRGIDGVLDALKDVWASAYTERALTYRRHLGLSLTDISVAVIVQQLIEAQQAGVMFTRHPQSDNAQLMLINSVRGFGADLVGAGAEGDSYTVDKQTLEFTAQLVEQTEQLVMVEGGGKLTHVAVDDSQRTPSSLTDQQVREISLAGLAIERHFGRPQDVEFCYDKYGKLFILQSRPVSQIAECGPAAGNHLVWDNSNIIESYSGVTSPMTFSFVRRVYAIVYHCFAEVMGVSPRVIHTHRRTYDNMLGLFRGRVYYNLKNWYRSLRLLPGFRYNSRFMESMMGLKEPLELDDEPLRLGWTRRWFVEFPMFVRLLVRSAWNFCRIQKTVAHFEANFRSHYETWAKLDFRSLPPHALQSLYYEMEDALLWNWKAPILNDFLVMIFYGVLKQICQSWCGDETGSLQNELLCGEGGVESVAPAKMLLQLAKAAQDDPRLRKLILCEPLPVLPQLIADDERFSEFNQRFNVYLERFGFRCVDELKLEEYSLRDRPHLIYQVIRSYLLLDSPQALDVEAISTREQRIRREAEQRAFSQLSKLPGVLPRQAVFRWVLKQARLGVKNRENMRFARTRIYGLVREIIRAMGTHFAAEGILSEADDIFYLTIDEMWDFVKGTAATTDLRGLTRLRRAEFDGYRSEKMAPCDRFETYGMAYHRNRFRQIHSDVTETPDGTLRGVGCCPGVVVGTVKVVRKPTDDVILSGEILVAARMDPGWIPLFPAASGILIERGSILSHSAVVAREMGIPTIVGIAGLLNAIQTDTRVRMDGRSGTIEILSGRPDEPRGETS